MAKNIVPVAAFLGIFLSVFLLTMQIIGTFRAPLSFAAEGE